MNRTGITHRIFVAEKPSVARSIAAELGVVGRDEGFLRCRHDSAVTWCFGHMFELAEPDVYLPEGIPRTAKGRKRWRQEDLPILPAAWKLQVKRDAQKQLKVIGRLLRQATEIIHAGDPDREGQLLVDEVLAHFGVLDGPVPVRRFWVSAQDQVSIQRGLHALRANTSFLGMADAARARQRADWLVGMNLSRAYTLRAQRGGARALLTIGRVQTPTLALVVERDRVIERFVPQIYYLVKARFAHPAGLFIGTWQPEEDQPGLDPEGRLLDIRVAEQIVAQVEGQPGVVSLYQQQAKSEPPPLPFALSDITLLASRRFSYSADTVLRACQALYETHKLTSYPRTDCSYLPEAQHHDAPRVLAALHSVNPDLQPLIDRADPNLRSRAWNDRKVTAHHGIIPTMHLGDRKRLTEQERKIYDLIVRRYLAQFYPTHTYLSTRAEVRVAQHRFTATGKQVTREGFREVLGTTDADRNRWRASTSKTSKGGAPGDKPQASAEPQPLPPMARGDSVRCTKAQFKATQTEPPARYTEGTLIRAMEEVHKHVQDPQHRKLLREGDGIGTSATRATILSELKRKEFLEARGKWLHSTALGRALVDAVPSKVKDPALTALYERSLKTIENQQGHFEQFVSAQEDFVRERVAEAASGALALGPELQQAPFKQRARSHPAGRRKGTRTTKRTGTRRRRTKPKRD